MIVCTIVMGLFFVELPGGHILNADRIDAIVVNRGTTYARAGRHRYEVKGLTPDEVVAGIEDCIIGGLD